jgi:hypothetical protein
MDYILLERKIMDLIKYGYKYKNEYAIEKTSGGDRLIVAPESGHINMMLDLLREGDDDGYFILYVLIVSRCDNTLGRYQSANLMAWDELNMFCKKYSSYLETDGRHHFWITNYDTQNFVVYDHHNVLYVYGDIETKIKILEDGGYKKVEKIVFEAPHTHFYNEENDCFENEIIKASEWIVFSLQEEHDTYSG